MCADSCILLDTVGSYEFSVSSLKLDYVVERM